MLKTVYDSKGRSTGTKFEHLNSVWKMTRKKPKELDFPDYDQSVSHLIDLFYDLKESHGKKISYTEIKNFQDLMNIDLASWQVEAIKKIDDLFERQT